jgi:hypothetical protein
MSQITAGSAGLEKSKLAATDQSAAPHKFVVPKKPLLKEINLRMVLLGALAFLFIGFPFYIWMRDAVNGGIINYGDYSEVNLKAMSSFDMDQVNGQPSDIPARFRALEGKRVLFVGEMWEGQSAGDVSPQYFQLVYSIAKCCFSGPPLAQHFVDANVVPGHKVYYYPNTMVNVWGTMHIRFRKDPGGVIKSIYEVDVDKIEPQ